MSKLVKASQVGTALTFNGAVTNKSSLDACVDLFFIAGASRGKDISTTFHRALDQDPEITGRMLLWLRDILEGSGEREQFKILIKELIYKDVALAERILKKLPEAGIGRWDDLFVAFGTPLQSVVVKMMVDALNNGDKLCAKWMPRRRKGKPNSELRILAANFTEGSLDYKVKEMIFRKKVAQLSETVEQQMCAGKWDEINFNHVPSKANQKYRKAFYRNAEGKYVSWLDSLVKKDGDAKVNAKATHPHDITRMLLQFSHWNCSFTSTQATKTLAEAQWEALPNYVEGSDEKILPMIDVSGSMCSNNGLPLLVAITLGAYFAQRNSGEFAGEILTFTSTPSFVKVPQGLEAGLKAILQSPVGYDTNIQKAFELILKTAVRNNLSQEDLPTKLLVVSDMEFNTSCISGKSVSALNAVKVMYERAGYRMPQIIFWNVNGREGNSPVTVHDTGTALISGFSPSILTAVMKGAEDLTPRNVMLTKLMTERYNF